MVDFEDRATRREGAFPGFRLGIALFGALILAAVALTACGGSDSSSDDSGDEGGGGGASSALVQEAKDLVAELTSTTKEWDGPTAGPTAEPGKTLAYIACTSTTPVCVEAGQEIEEIAPEIGWEVRGFSGGQGTQQEVTQAWNQALAMNPDGIINVATDAVANNASLLEAQRLGIPVVGVLSTAEPGAADDVNEFANVSQDPAAIGRAMAMYPIAETDGEARVTIDGVAGYDISKQKTDAMQAVMEECGGCELLAFNQADLSSFEADTPQLMAGWVSEFGPDFWTLVVADAIATPMVPPLRQGQVPTDGVKIVGSDGSPEAFERIRNDEYQVASIPQSPEQLAYQAMDELNRAFNDEPPSGFAQPLHLVTSENVDENGGEDNRYSGTEGFREQYMAIWTGE